MSINSQKYRQCLRVGGIRFPIEQSEGAFQSVGGVARCMMGALFAIACSSIHAAGNELAELTSIQNIPIRGVVRPSAKAVISSDLTARIKRVRFQEGEAFDKGEVLIEFDCRRQKAELRSANAKRREMLVSLKSALVLNRRRANSRQDVETAQARADIAAAEADAIEARLSACVFIAPYSGYVTEMRVHEHETAKPGSALLSIASRSRPRIELIVPSQWLTWLKTGTAFQYVMDDTGKSHVGVVTRLGASVDTVSQTIKVFANFKEAPENILPGMSGTARFQRAGE